MFGKKSTRDLVRGGSPMPDTTPDAILSREEPKKKKEKKIKPPRKREGKGERTAFFHTKAFLGLASLLIGLAIAFAGIPILQVSLTKTQQIVCFKSNVQAGTKITRELLKTEDMSAHNLPAGAIRNVRDCVGQYVKADAIAGDIVTANRVSAAYPGVDPQLADLPTDKVAISVSLEADLAQSVSGKLREGDVIQLFAVEDNTSLTAAAIPELQYVEVLAATYSDGEDAQKKGKGEQEENKFATVTLLANQQQAACLAGLDHNATLHAALVTRGDHSAKKKALAAQEEYFASAPEDTETAALTAPTAAENTTAEGGN